jgi:hypothetical protein
VKKTGLEQNYHQKFQNNIRLSNDVIEVIVTTEVGPRIIKYSFINGENILGEHFEVAVKTELGEWKPFAGHRLWIAPENMPNSYAPDNIPVRYERLNNLSIRLIQPIEPITQTQKEIAITIEETGNKVFINHKIINRGKEAKEFSAWALTIMRGGGICEIPNEKYEPYSAKTLLPVRNLTCWSYTNLSDSRWQFDRDFIRLKVDKNKPEEQKIGVLNKQGWVAYNWQNLRFTKSFQFVENAVYPDLNSNTELYVAGDFIEVESLSPLQIIAPNDYLSYDEMWKLEKIP